MAPNIEVIVLSQLAAIVRTFELLMRPHAPDLRRDLLEWASHLERAASTTPGPEAVDRPRLRLLRRSE